MTSVWPALWPPWKRTTTSARSDSQSTILPLPSSPHWAPTTATLAMRLLPPSFLRQCHGTAGLQNMRASQPAGLADFPTRGIQGADSGPALGPPGGSHPTRCLGRKEQARLGLGARHGAQQGIEIEGKSGGGLALGAE